MKFSSFEEMLVWQKAQQLSLELYTLLRKNKDYSFKDQILRAAMSVSNNIAEGFERQSNAEFRHFLFIAKGSCAEVRSMNYIADQLHYFSVEESKNISHSSFQISKMISGLIKTL